MDTIRLNAFDAAAIVIVLAAVFGYLNQRFVRLPHTVALAIMGALASMLVAGLDAALPQSDLAGHLQNFLDQVDFQNTLMQGMLSFLLFAGALHVDWEQVRLSRWPIGVLSSVGVLVSALIVAAGFKLIAHAAGLDLPFIWCLVFGALISPTDPVAVLSVLKRANVPPRLYATVGGESLFNDGIGIVIFSIVLAAAVGGGNVSLLHGAEMFLLEAFGGAALGLAIGWVALRAMRSIDEYNVEVLITLAVVMGGYVIAKPLGVSGPVAMAVAGLAIGNHGVAQVMSEVTRDHLIKFWSVLDDILNSVLFLLIGLEAAALIGDPRTIGAALLAIPLALAARAISVGAPLWLWREPLPYRTAFPVLTWGGLRGGISLAMALSLPAHPAKSLILASTYAVVMFSVIVQGSTFGRLVRRLEAAPAEK